MPWLFRHGWREGWFAYIFHGWKWNCSWSEDGKTSLSALFEAYARNQEAQQDVRDVPSRRRLPCFPTTRGNVSQINRTKFESIRRLAHPFIVRNHGFVWFAGKFDIRSCFSEASPCFRNVSPNRFGNSTPPPLIDPLVSLSLSFFPFLRGEKEKKKERNRSFPLENIARRVRSSFAQTRGDAYFRRGYSTGEEC